MKILYCIPSMYNAGGMERVITEKVNFLADLPQYEIIIVTTDQIGRGICFKINSKIKIIHLDIDFNAQYSSNLIKKYFSHQRKLHIYKTRLVQLIEEMEIDICISLCGKEIEFLSALKVPCKKIAEIHFSMNFRKQFLIARHNGFIWKYLGGIRTQQLKRSVKRLDKLIVLTKNDQKQWERTHNNILHIPNPNPFQNSTNSLLEAKRVISIGKLDAQKGYDMLIDSWNLVSDQHPDWTLDIYGSGEWKEMLEKKINDYHLTGKINLKGTTNDVISNYLDSSIYVMSSRYEGFGMVLIEAMLCGLPAVSFDCEYGPGEIITDGIDGFLVPPNNIKLLADKICELIENDSLRKQMGANARKKVERYSKEIIMPQWIKLFDSLVK